MRAHDSWVVIDDAQVAPLITRAFAGEVVELAPGPALVAGTDGHPVAEPVRRRLEAAVHQG